MMQNYVWSRRREMAGWLELPAHKSALLQTVTAAGPALLVLGRRWPLAPAADLAATAPVRRMWLEYNNCNRSEAVVNLGDRIASTLAVLRPVGARWRRLVPAGRRRRPRRRTLAGPNSRTPASRTRTSSDIRTSR
ncbi:uncharacterized protein LOC119113552 [Pollicipes pollicipes]|uniref:uncharacterized protein LOC119113552 n=1 Tax=Pollicipes pollicipes TaxID=41117 RepID=UPI0018854EB6|nr:uncharacterized protein LOC119113552 [Pollicipes pollicipes]